MVKVTENWQLQTAKNKFSEVVNNALDGRAQLVTKNGKPAVYVVSAAQYERLQCAKKSPLKKLLVSRPHKDIELNIDRQTSSGRDVEL